MLYSYNLLQSFVKQKLVSASKLNEMFNMCLGDTSFQKVNNDYVFDVELTPNRIAVLAGHKNMAKEVCAMMGFDFKTEKEYKIAKVAKPVIMSVKNDAKKSCEGYLGIVLANIKIKESPQFIKDALNNCGLRAINNVVDITNYVMLVLGQPMHAFDYDKIEGSKINVRYAKKGEEITVLTGDKYTLNENILVIADGVKPMAIAGIKGGVTGEIDKNTKTIMVESANFNSVDIYKASKALGLVTDASVRFSHKLDLSVTKEALKIAVELFVKYANAKVVSNVLKTTEIDEKPLIIPFNLSRVTKLVGEEIPEKEIEKTLVRLGYKIKKISKNLWNVFVPLYRNNVLIFEDVVDDVARIHGFDNLKAKAPVVELSTLKLNEFYQFKDNLKDYMIMLGLDEVYNYSFVNESDVKFLNLETEKQLISLRNCLSANFKYLKPVSFISLLKNVNTNLSYFDKAKFFQVDKNYISVNDVVFEKACLSFCSYDINKKKKEQEMLLEAKGMVESVFSKLGITNSQYYFSDKYTKGEFETSKISKTIIYIYNQSEELLGYITSINDNTKVEYKIKNDQKNPLVVLGEIEIDKLFKLAQKSIDFKAIPKFPSSIRDISVMVNKKVLVNEVMMDILTLNIDDLKDIDIFDIYEAEDNSQKSLSFHLIFRNEEKTLENIEVEKYLELIKQNLIKKGYIIR